MTTSQNSILSEVVQAERISEGTFAYFQERLQNELHNVILEEFSRLENTGEMTRAKLARRIGRAPEQVTRWLGVGGNWTVDTISRLVTAMRGQLRIEFLPLREASSVRPTEEDSALLGVIQGMTTGKQPAIEMPLPKSDARPIGRAA
jgi:DNA-binding phage protein